MTASDLGGPEQFRLLATFIARRAVDVAEAPSGVPAYTNGQVVFVSSGGSAAEQRREVLIQSALLGAGSLDPQYARALRRHPSTARRYLVLEGHRVLAELATTLPLAAALRPNRAPSTATIEESLEMARGPAEVADAPGWFGAIKASQLLVPLVGAGAQATDKDVRLEFNVIDVSDPDNDDGEPDGESKILKLFESPIVTSRTVAEFLRKLFGSSRAAGDGTAGGELQVGSIRRVPTAGPDARPLPTRIRFTDDGRPGAVLGVVGSLHPEWDVFKNCYRPDWCRVIEFPLTAAVDVAAAGVPHDEVLRRRLSRVGLGPKVLRARPDGDEVDIDALIDLSVDLRAGSSPPEHIYAERQKLARDLGVLVLLDASGSATDTDPDGLAVHDHQRRAAATLAVTLEELGDRVAVYAFRSHGRHAVHLPAIKTFGQRFGAGGRARLKQLRPAGYTRLGAGIRGAGEILKAQAGTPNRLLLLLSDGFPYDEAYEGHYAEADAYKALEELRADGVACLCLSLGAPTGGEALERVFGSASRARAESLAELSPRMDELFLSALRELAAPQLQGG